MLEGEGIHHRNEKQDQHDLDENIQTDPNPANVPVCPWLLCLVSHLLQPPFTELERLISERQHQNGHTHIEHDWPAIDYAPRECPHVFDGGEVAQQIASPRSNIQKDELNQAEKK